MAVQPDEVVKAVVTHTIADEVITQSVWYYWLDAALEVATATVMDAIIAKVEAIYDDMKSYIHQSTSLDGIKFNIWEWNPTLARWETGRLLGIDSLVDTFEGSVTAFPNQIAAVMTAFTTDVNTRSRKSFGGLIETFATENEIAGAPLAAMVAALAEWLTVIDLGGGDALYPMVPDKLGVIRVLLYGLVSGLAGTQRQRKVGEGI